MYNLLIVDDEPIEREAMKLLVDDNFHDITVIGEADNGYDAIKLACELVPDIILVDINMPGIDGLETIREIVNRGILSKFIIVTAYNKFEYAQKAIRLGVEDYMLKPADIATIRATFESVKCKIDSEIDSNHSHKILEKRLNEIQPVIESDLILHLLEEKSNQDFYSQFNLLGINPCKGFVMVAEGSRGNERFMERTQNHLKNLGLHCIADAIHNRIIFIVVSDSDEAQCNYADAIEILKHDQAQNRVSVFYVGIGEELENINDLGHSYLTALRCLKYGKRNNLTVCVKEELDENSSDSVFPIQKYVDFFVEKILVQEKEEIDEVIELFFVDLFMSNSSIFDIRRCAYQVMILVRQKISQRIPYFNSSYDIDHDKDYLLSSEDSVYIKTYFKSGMNTIFNKMDTGRESRQNVIAFNAIEFINTNFNRNISLEDLSNHLNISTSYASKLIKKTTDQNFTDILTKVRIHEAIRLLREDKMSIKEVTFTVGFNSQHYFSRIFKKFTGLTPSEFRNRRFQNDI